MQRLRGAGCKERDARGAEPGLAAPGGGSSCGRGRTSGRVGAEPPSNDSGGAGAEHPTARANYERSRADTMPKCPRCQKEVYFGKGCLPPPSIPHPPAPASYPRAACPGCCRLLRCPTTVHPCAMSPWRALDGPLNPPEERSCGVPPTCPWGAQHSASALLSPCSPTGPAGCLAAVRCSPHPREVGCKGLRVLLVSTVLVSVA